MKYVKNFGKFLFLTAIACVFMTFTGCKGKNPSESSKLPSEGENSVSQLKITATFYPLYISLLNITENVPDVKLSLLAPANTGCLHDYQLTTKDMKAISGCDILVANGLDMEDFLDKAINLKKDSIILAADSYDESKLVEDNPHIWVSLKGAEFQANRICEGLCRLNPENAELYKKNTEAYCKKINELSEKMHSELDKYEGTKIITFHEAFPYFAREFNLNLIAVMENEEGQEPSAKDLSALIEKIKSCTSKAEKIALFGEENFPSSAAEILSRETGLTIGILDPSVTGNLEKDAYLIAMEKNLKTLTEAFSK